MLKYENFAKVGDVIRAYDFQGTKGAYLEGPVIEKGDVKVIVDSQSAPLLNGAEVDYVDSLQGSGFAIKNPQAKSTCGCGSSFST